MTLDELFKVRYDWPDGVGGRDATMLRAAYAAWMTGETETALSLAQAGRLEGTASSRC